MKFLKTLPARLALLFLFIAANASAQQEAPDALVKRISQEILELAKTDQQIQAGNQQRIMEVVQSKIIPHVNFQRMTASAVGPGWRQATPEQQKRLQEEFKALLVRTYAGAVNQVNDQTIVVKPLRASPDDKEVIVRTEVRGKGDPTQLDYRVEKAPDAPSGWRIYNQPEGRSEEHTSESSHEDLSRMPSSA